MGKIIDYKCVNEETSNHIKNAARDLGLSLPEGHFKAESMAKLSKKIKENRGHSFCILPFCHTIEGEALGAILNYGDETTGPRVKEYKYSSLKELLDLKMDFESKRIKEVIEAIEILKRENEVVLLEITGPITLLSTLIDAKYVYKGLRKEKELMYQLFKKVEDILIEYIKRAKEAGVDIISFADSTAGVNILGPKMSVDLIDLSTLSFLKRFKEEFKGEILMHLCPKTTYALIGDERAIFKEVLLHDVVRYGDAIKNLKGRVTFLGDRCLNHLDDLMTNKIIREIVLL